MWPFGKTTPRRREVRRIHNVHLGRAVRALRRQVVVPSLLLGLFLVASCFVILVGDTAMTYRVGSRVSQPVVAQVDFTWEDPIKAARDQHAARSGTPNYYRLNTELRTRAGKDLEALSKLLKEVAAYEEFKAKAAAAGWSFDEGGWHYLRNMVNDRPEQWQKVRDDFLRRLVDSSVIHGGLAEKRDPPSPMNEVVFLSGDVRTGDLRERRDFPVDLKETGGLRKAAEAITYAPAYSTEPFASLPAAARDGFARYLETAMAPAQAGGEPQPVYVFDAKETQHRMDLAAKAVDSTESYSEGQELVPRNTTITDAHLDLLRAERRAYQEKLRNDPVLHHQFMLHQLGICGVVLAAVLGLALYTLRYRPQVFATVQDTAELLLLILAGVILCRWLATSGFAYADRWAIMPVWLVGSIVAIATQQRYAIGVTLATALLAALALRSPSLGEYVLLAGSTLTAVGLLGDIRTRTKLVAVGMLAGGAAFALSFFVDLAMLQPVQYVVRNAALAGVATVGASLLLHAVLPVLERFFGIVTGMTLLEWCDINKPLLRRLAREAPGTYNHALVLGSMAEAASESIGAHGLLTRVGAYYHDIGKINKPRYFVENQQSGANWHDRLSPTMSLLIIIGHVKDGLELAREYGLPRALWQFIAEHHGTTLVRYFYRQAADRQGAQQVTESDFRYPGPKPRSRETAILMLCDSVEGAVRALSEPTPGRIEGLVHDLVMDRLADGQFEDCDITLRELHRVEESMVKSLCAIYHGRIAYPSAKEPARPAAHAKPAQAQTA